MNYLSFPHSYYKPSSKCKYPENVILLDLRLYCVSWSYLISIYVTFLKKTKEEENEDEVKNKKRKSSLTTPV